MLKGVAGFLFVPMNVIAKWMGHTTEEMMQLYQHLFPQDEQQWMKRFPI